MQIAEAGSSFIGTYYKVGADHPCSQQHKAISAFVGSGGFDF